MEAGFLSAKRCGRTRRVRINGAVRLAMISVAIAASLEVVGSAKEDEVHDASVDEGCVDGWEGGSDFGDLGREGLEVGHVELNDLLAHRTQKGIRGLLLTYRANLEAWKLLLQCSEAVLSATSDDEFLSKSVEAASKTFTESRGGSNNQDGIH